jgi:hypothetical protein
MLISWGRRRKSIKNKGKGGGGGKGEGSAIYVRCGEENKKKNVDTQKIR